MKKQHFFILLFSFLFLSCASIRFKELEIDQTQALKGSVKEIKIKKEHSNFRLDLGEKDTVTMTEEYTFLYAKNNQLIKQFEDDETGEVAYIFSYNEDGTLKNQILKYPGNVSRQEYKYDEKKNNFEYLHFENDTLVFRKTKKFDSNNNPVEINYINPQSTKLDCRVTYSYDYQTKSAICKTFDYNNIEKDHYLKYNYDKRGNIIKSETIQYKPNNPNPYYSVKEYDNSDNIIKHTIMAYGSSRTINYIYEYDRVGNIVKSEKYYDGKLILKINNQITYY